MASAQQGDSKAYDLLLRDVISAVRGFAKRRLGDDAAVEDVTQEVLLSLHRARHTYRTDQPFEPWMWAIARNAVTDAQRLRARRASRENPLPEGDELHDLLSRGGAEDSVDAEQLPLSPALATALSELSSSQREAVSMIHLEGLSVAEAALRTGVSPGAIKVRAHRGYRALRAMLQGPRS
jgi:RNA polymerase sigma-70 factor (ECF subfamily)